MIARLGHCKRCKVSTHLFFRAPWSSQLRKLNTLIFLPPWSPQPLRSFKTYHDFALCGRHNHCATSRHIVIAHPARHIHGANNNISNCLAPVGTPIGKNKKTTYQNPGLNCIANREKRNTTNLICWPGLDHQSGTTMNNILMFCPGCSTNRENRQNTYLIFRPSLDHYSWKSTALAGESCKTVRCS